MSFQTPPEQIATLEKAVAELKNGKWDRNDVRAISLIFGVLASLAMSIYTFAGTLDPSPEPAPVESAGTDTDAATGTDTE